MAPRSGGVVRRPGASTGEKFISGENKQDTVKSMVLRDAARRPLFCGPAEPARCADITHARQGGLVCRTWGAKSQ